MNGQDKEAIYKNQLPAIINSTLFYLLQTSPSQVKAATDLHTLGVSYLDAKVISPAEITNLFSHYMENVSLFNQVTIALHYDEQQTHYIVDITYQHTNQQYIMPADFFETLVSTEGATQFAEWLSQVIQLVIAVRLAEGGSIEEEEVIMQTEVAVKEECNATEKLNEQMLSLYRLSDEAQRQTIKALRADLFEIEFALAEEQPWHELVVAFQQALLALELEEVAALKTQIAMLRIVTSLLQQSA
ncbi:MAG TPA: hypothetical protein K8V30_00665 [Metalysinibacillus jejuensis]|uniref:Uncharacterized protein n=1 Tax=Metalysinibacillus jejuensis TaxID=914327 RepID=A0A921NAC8_9BACL|nr:hypothetical protein [Metalysinibacillus jejuensis]HJH10200.1 hypothetical protein [Metalysinibacillus jejuensis]